MSWETRLFTSIPYNRKTYNSKWEVQNDYDELTSIIKRYKQRLRDLVIMTEPSKWCDCDSQNPYYFVTNEYEDIIEELEDCIIERFKLGILLGDWENCHNREGLAIDPPDGIKFDTAFLDGDFVLTVKHPTNESLLQ